MAKGHHHQPTRRVHRTAGPHGSKADREAKDSSIISRVALDLSWDQVDKVAVKEVALHGIANTTETVVAVGETTLPILLHVEVTVGISLQV